MTQNNQIYVSPGFQAGGRQFHQKWALALNTYRSFGIRRGL